MKRKERKQTYWFQLHLRNFKYSIKWLIFMFFAITPNINMESETEAVTLIGFRRLSRGN